MKKDIHPGIIAAVIACLVVVIGVYFWKSAIAVPSYPGAGAKPPASESAGGGGSSAMAPPTTTVSQEEAQKMRIPGVSHPMNKAQ